MPMADLRRAGNYPDAWVTGASSGIGAAFARALAARGSRRLVLVARRTDRLEALARELRARAGLEVVVRSADLTRTEAVDALAAALASSPPDLLVNNAGAGLYGAFTSLEAQPQLATLDLNIRALVHLSHAYLRACAARNHGDLLLVASGAGFAPVPYEAVYAASKSFVVHFGEAVHEELRGTGVRVRVLCPGFTETEFAAAAGLPAAVHLQHGIRAEDVVDTGFAALAGGAPTVLHGRGTHWAATLGRIGPRRLVLRAVGTWMRRGLTAPPPT
jgi:short-subunit dehydrogenase